MNNLQNKVSLLQVQTLLILFMSFFGVNSVYAQKTKKVECGVCSGSGVSACLGCSGTGVTMSSYMDMNGYFWPVQVECRYCAGTGGVRCSWCNGRGYTRVPVANQNRGNRNGGYSGGTLIVPNNSGSSSSSGSTYTTCSGCGGSGKCTGCGGSGKYWVDSGMYTGSGSRTQVNCGSCGGSGRCGVCHGRGRL